ncbi:MAG: ribonuclease H-like domain-containing protein [Verrucomicrobiota bacterium]
MSGKSSAPPSSTIKIKRVNRLFWDIETSPNVVYSWRCGPKVHISHDNIIKERAIICICWKWEHEEEVHALTWDDNQCDRAMLEAFLVVAKQADELVAQNGDRFDIKWFNTRCMYHRLEAIGDWKTVDTLKMAKSKQYFNSNRLDYMGKFLFNEGKIDVGFDLWKAICENNDPIALKTMVDYCRRDVGLLQEVWEVLSRYTKPRTHVGVHNKGEKWSCPYTGSENVEFSKKLTTAAGTVQYRMHSPDAEAYYTISQKSFHDYLEAKAEANE